MKKKFFKYINELKEKNMSAYDRLKKQINETNYLQGMTFMNGPVKCIKSAINFFTLAANHGCEKSQLKLAYMYVNGQGVAKDESTAVKWYLKAAQQGNAYAQV